jgi:NTP pyrophosphatase (non-canonical NTP hydrolase)
MSIAKLQSEIRAFVEARDWDQFHDPKNLAIGLSTEASELLQLFRFQDGVYLEELLSSSEGQQKIRDEIGDVFFFLLRIADKLDVSLEQCLRDKMEKSAKKYPEQDVKGNPRKRS